MRRAAAWVPLACAACVGETAAPSDLIAVSGVAPWSASCAGPAGQGTVSRDAEVEPALAADPSDPKHLIGVWQQDRWSNGGANGLVSGTSFDGGRTWTLGAAKFTRCSGGVFDRATDPWVSIGEGGVAYQIGYAFDMTAPNRAMLVSRSMDGGRSWEAPIVLQQDTDPDLAMDKETITADPLDGRYAYAVWDRLTGFTNPTNPQNTGPVWFARTTDRGATWEAARNVYDPGPDAQTIANQIVVLPDATLVDLLVVISNNSSTNPIATITVVRSKDRGNTWLPPVAIAEAQFVGVTDAKTKTGVRTGSVVPGIGVDRASGALYVAWEDARFSQGAHDSVALSKSIDGGSSWSAPAQVNVKAPGAPAFTPAVAVADGGTLGVSFYDLRNDDPADHTRLTVTHWLATSNDGGKSFSETSIGTPFNLQGAPLVDGPAYFLGDYQGLAHAGAVFLPFFAAVPDGGGAANIYFRPADAATARAGALELAVEGVQEIWRGARERWRFGTLFK
ncbi:MAG TPA: sialidase family protein [Myxococcales bacterium]|nr:sialidase family protein [Myxococcales bacterium]